MEFTNAVFSRKMTRYFAPQPVDETILDQLFTAALRSPSAGFSQGVDLLVLTDEKPRRQFWESISDEEWRNSSHLATDLMVAPTIIVPLGNPLAYEDRYRCPDKQGSSLADLDAKDWPVPYWTVDASFVAMALLLGASDAELGAFFFHLQGHEHDLKVDFAIPEHFVPIGAIAVGHAAGSQDFTKTEPPPRRPTHEVIHRERW